MGSAAGWKGPHLVPCPNHRPHPPTPPPHLHLLHQPVRLRHRQQPVGLAQRGRRVPKHEGRVGEEAQLQDCQGREGGWEHAGPAFARMAHGLKAPTTEQQHCTSEHALHHHAPVVPGAANRMCDRPAPCGPSTTRARWNRAIVWAALTPSPPLYTTSCWAGKAARMAAVEGSGRIRCLGQEVAAWAGQEAALSVDIRRRDGRPSAATQPGPLPSSSAASLPTRRVGSPSRDT